ncbi:virulence RhuM family protein, partial [Candidatus Gottesmanbacteria bacterium]|nr:virulence RhuM family protein [Candidatus Gottesmanbacteria bacterium]
MGKNQIIIYETKDGQAKVEVRFENKNVWLTQKLLARLFDVSVPTVNEHLANIFKTGELSQKSVVRNFRITGADNKSYLAKHFSLEAIVAVGYRVNSLRGTQFRIWATQRLKEYIIKGFTIDEKRLKEGGGKSRYFEELLQKIRDIRSSERVLYQKVTDIYSTAVDYRKDSEETKTFFATVQNKLHYAVTGKTAAEIITGRANSKKLNAGLTNFPGDYLIQRDIYIAKNYLNKIELEKLNRIVDAYLSFAEIQARDETPMTMKDWINKLDKYLKLLGKGVLKNAGEVSAEKAKLKAEKEFEEYKKSVNKKLISDFDK